MQFWGVWRNNLIICIVFTLFVSLLLIHTLSYAYYSLLLIPLSYFGVKTFYKSTVRCDDRIFIFSTFFVAFGVRVLSVFIFSYILKEFNDISFLSYKDDFVYHEASKEIVDRWNLSGINFYNDIHFSTGFYSGFPNVSAFFMFFFGKSIFIPRIANSFFSALTCVLSYKICRTFGSIKESRLVVAFFVFSPLLYTFSALQLKDTILLYLTFLEIYSMINVLLKKSVLQNILKIVVLSIVIAFFRAAVIVPLFLSFLIVATYTSIKNNNIRYFISNAFVLIVLLFLAYYLWDIIASYGGIASPENYFRSRFEAMSSSSIQTSNINSSGSPLLKLLGAPIYIILGLFLPPALLVTLHDQETINYTLFGMLFHYSILPFLIVSFFFAFKHRKKEFIPFFIVVLVLLFRIGQANTILSVFSPRQSLSSMFIMYLCLPCFFNIKKTAVYNEFLLIICLLISLAYTVFRLNSHGMI